MRAGARSAQTTSTSTSARELLQSTMHACMHACNSTRNVLTSLTRDVTYSAFIMLYDAHIRTHKRVTRAAFTLLLIFLSRSFHFSSFLFSSLLFSRRALPVSNHRLGMMHMCPLPLLLLLAGAMATLADAADQCGYQVRALARPTAHYPLLLVLCNPRACAARRPATRGGPASPTYTSCRTRTTTWAGSRRSTSTFTEVRFSSSAPRALRRALHLSAPLCAQLATTSRTRACSTSSTRWWTLCATTRAASSHTSRCPSFTAGGASRTTRSNRPCATSSNAVHASALLHLCCCSQALRVRQRAVLVRA